MEKVTSFPDASSNLSAEQSVMTERIIITGDIARPGPGQTGSVMTLCLKVYELPTVWYLQVPVLSPGQGDVPGGGERNQQQQEEEGEISDHGESQQTSGGVLVTPVLSCWGDGRC